MHYGSKLGDTNWNKYADINGDNRVSLMDARITSNSEFFIS